MDINFTEAAIGDAEVIGSLVIRLTQEICERTHAQHFDIDLEGTIDRCKALISADQYSAIIARAGNTSIAVATIAETHALYASGKIGIIQEFYVVPEQRSKGIGAMLLDHVRSYGRKRDWSCLELCTPPLPEFEKTLGFYERQGLLPVGGRKMRQFISPLGTKVHHEHRSDRPSGDCS